MSFLTREQILNADDGKFVDVDVPEWGGTVRVRSLTAGQREAWEQYVKLSEAEEVSEDEVEPKFMFTLRSALLSMCLTDETNEPLFTSGDIGEIANKDSTIVIKLFSAAKQLNAITKADFEAILANFTQSQSTSSNST
jgi:hypothetical protein